MGDIVSRKQDHLDLCATDEVAFRERTTLLEEVQLVHQALPELALDEVDTRTELFGKTLRAPMVIASMTGGTELAGRLNAALASVAEERGYAVGVGSQRAMLRRPETTETFEVRRAAPTALVLGNVGVVQARDLATADVGALAARIGADALCVHMNPAMEIVQPEGDRDFRGGLATFERLARELPIPIIAKETGSGVSFEVASKLRDVGIRAVDVSGAGGTSWVGVETLRATGAGRALGEALWDWGIPTAASIVLAARAGHTVIATGGVASGLDVARAIALGASAAGIARPVYRAFVDGGREGVAAFLDAVERELRAVLLLTGSRTPAELRRAPRVIGARLREWLSLANVPPDDGRRL